MKGRITQENARDFQARAAKKRKENTAKRRALKELLMDELSKPVEEGSKTTKLEWLIMKAIDNTRDDVTLGNLQQLQDLLGEKQTNSTLSITASRPAEDCAREILDEIGD